MRLAGVEGLGWVLAAASALGQGAAAPAAPLAFDVASVRPSKSGEPQRSNVPLNSGYVYGSLDAEDARTAAGGHLVVTHVALWRYISFAYKLSGTQELSLRFNMFSGAPKSGAPFWVTGSFEAQPDFYDISAVAPADTTIEQMRLMMQALLAERFHLVVHFVSAEAPVFGLVLAKGGALGPDLRPHPAADGCAAAAGGQAGLPPVCGVIAHVPSTLPGQHYGGRAVSLSLLATTLPTMTGLAAMPRPVVDQTGLTGLYDFSLTWVHDPNGEDATSENTANFRDALKRQLGLELKASRAPISFLIVDRVERPTEN
jgi:uncharacterized protein (TIGR03435 family)